MVTPIIGVNDLCTLRPDLVEEWDNEANENGPEQYSVSSSYKAIWKCKTCGQLWPAIISSRTRGTGCPFCAGKQPIPGCTDLATLRPDLIEEWNYEANEKGPESYTVGSNQKVIWKCKSYEKSWTDTINHRTHGRGCPFCAGKRPIPGLTDLATSRPDLVEEWDRDNNANGPEQYTVSSRYEAIWKCKTCRQSWHATIAQRTHGCGCPFCAGKRPIPGQTDLATLQPDLVEEWDFEANEKGPENYTVGSGQKVVWKCKSCGQSWLSTIRDRKNGCGCPFCAKRRPIPGKTDLATLRPNLVEEWNYDENEKGPESYTVSSNQKVAWKCKKCKQSWSAIINSRSKGSGCPYCAGKLPIPGITDLATLNPELAAEWDYDANKSGPENYTVSSGHKVCWKCKNCRQSWMAKILSRNQGCGCPYCAGQLPIPGQTDLATLYPDLVAEWDNIANEKKPEQFTVSSESIVVWKCKVCGQSWSAAIFRRTKKGCGCPFCAGKRPIPGRTDLATLRPDLAEEWDSEANENGPENYTVGSGQIVVWKCKACNQSWSTSISKRNCGSGCPFCFGRRPIPGRTDLATLRPDLAEEWDFDANEQGPENYTVSSNKKVGWKCKTCNQRWSAVINDRNKGRGCPFCAGSRPIPGQTDLATVCPDLAIEWDFDANEKDPDQYTVSSGFIAVWKCKVCSQKWSAAISDRKKGTGCSFCLGRRPISGRTDLATLRPDLAAEWDHDANEKDPDQYTVSSGQKVFWKCKTCGQSWRATIASRNILGHGCPFCAGRRPIPGQTDLATLRPNLVEEWDYEANEKGPEDYTVGSSLKVFWKCKTCKQSWSARISHRSSGMGCPYCTGQRKKHDK